MDTVTKSKQKMPHLGKNIEKLRKLKGWKQEALALEIGLTQPQISAIEKSEEVDADILEKIAAAMNLTAEMIKEFDESRTFYSIDNKLENVTISDSGQGIHQVFSPIEKVVELYERLLASEKEKLEILKAQQTNH